MLVIAAQSKATCCCLQKHLAKAPFFAVYRPKPLCQSLSIPRRDSLRKAHINKAAPLLVKPRNSEEKDMGSLFSSNKISREELEMALSKVKQIVSSNPVIVFSKTYCGYCQRVKQLFSQLGATYKVIELDVESDGNEMQAALAEWTGQSTVPNVFIAGKHIGGCDTVTGKHQKGELVPLLNEAGAIANNSAQS